MTAKTYWNQDAPNHEQYESYQPYNPRMQSSELVSWDHLVEMTLLYHDDDELVYGVRIQETHDGDVRICNGTNKDKYE